ncbi:winged helix-turn-helix domain-containing protein [Pyramidobacter sp. SM-530-WT-4B]|uniref:Winged helix-turn-helix domain-containing protein n=1 Tax=Pyramidobacter porci TaxID=2605789 RepID=A0A6L5YAV0_9BACT|nr:winged helix-turn-helix domain-containing protein [Pyramidobacter porci]
MVLRYEISQEQKAEIELARKKNRHKRIELKLKVLSLRAEGKTLKEISEITEYHFTNVSKIISHFIHKGLLYFTQCHYLGNHRNMTYEQEEAVLAPYLEKAEKGEIVSVAEIAQAYQTAVGHTISPTQIYAVLKRHGWRKVMPRSRHPRKASEEVIEASKKLTLESRN